MNFKSIIPGAEHFTYGEMVFSDTAIRLGINNLPNDSQWKALESLAVKVLTPIRNQFGPIRIHSAFRCPVLNKAIGSGNTSNHLRGEAADIVPVNSGITLISIAEWIYKNLDFQELICEYFPTGWVHVAYRASGNAKELKLKDKNHNYSRLSWEEIARLY